MCHEVFLCRDADCLSKPLTLRSKACGPFRDAIEYKNLSTQYTGFEYCEKWPLWDLADFQGCTECLQVADNDYLANCT